VRQLIALEDVDHSRASFFVFQALPKKYAFRVHICLLDTLTLRGASLPVSWNMAAMDEHIDMDNPLYRAC
jgi:hypothetical protein